MTAVSISEIIAAVSSSNLAAGEENYPKITPSKQDENNPVLRNIAI